MSDLKRPTVYVGVDPGARGAYAVLWPDGEVEINRLPTLMPDRWVSFSSLASACLGMRIDATIEKPQAYAVSRVSAKTGKGMSANAQLSVMLKMGIGFGETIGAMASAGIWPVHRVVPQTWKAAMCKGIAVEGKAKSVAAAMALYEGSIDLTPDRGSKPDDNFADALLIAHYGRHVDQIPF